MCILKLKGGGRNCPVIVSYSVYFIKILFQGISDAAGTIFLRMFNIKVCTFGCMGTTFFVLVSAKKSLAGIELVNKVNRIKCYSFPNK